MTNLQITPDTAKELVDDGVKIFYVFDFDGVFNTMLRTRTFPATCFKSDMRISIPNPEYKPRTWNKTLNQYEVGTVYPASKVPKKIEVAWSSELVENLNKIAEDSRVQIIILSTWRETLGPVFERMGVKTAREILHLPWGGIDRKDQFYKGQALKYWLWDVNKGSLPEDPNSYLVWVDDEVLKSTNKRYRHGLPEPEFTDENSLLIAPNEDFGINRAEWSEIVEFTAKALK